MTERHYPELPQKHLDALLDHIYEHGTASEGIIDIAKKMLHFYVDADCAMRAAKDVAQPIGRVESAVTGASGFHVRLAEGADMPAIGTPLYTAAPATAAGPSDAPDVWRKRFADAVYADLAAADNQDVPLEEYPARILRVLDSIVGPRHPTVIRWRNDAIQACIAIAFKYCRDPESFRYLKQDLQALITAAPTTQALQPAAPQGEASEREAFDAWFIKSRGFDPRTDTTMRRDAWELWKAWKARAALAAQHQEAAPSQDAEDAARYRWLRDGNNVKQSPAMKIASTMYGLEWDVAIDAARAQQEDKP